MSLRKNSLGESKLGLSYYPAELLSKIKFNNLYKKKFNPTTLVDLGCGYNFLLSKKYVGDFDEIFLLDVSINQSEASKFKNVNVLLGDIHKTLLLIEENSIGFLYANNIIEHLENPIQVLKLIKRIVSKDSLIYISVPSWIGKTVLEFFAFVLKIAPIEEMQDHKAYYNKKELWTLLVNSGYEPGSIKIKRDKFGMTTMATISNDQRIR